MNQQPEKCHKCAQIPDDILMLACNHDLCLLCAAKSFAQNKSQKNDFYCEICGASTELDASSIYELEKIYIQYTINEKHNTTKKKIQDAQKELHSKSINQMSEPKLRNDSLQKSYQNSKYEKENLVKYQPPRHSSSYSAKTKTTTNNSYMINQYDQAIPRQRGYCNEHPEEEILYFCFDCLSKCICPECIIHGVHKNHEVKTIKKSYPIVKQIFEDVLEQNNQVQQIIEQQKDEINKRQSNQNSAIDSLKTQINQEFQLLHQLLNVKEQQLLEGLESIPRINSELLEKQIDQLNEKISSQLNLKEEHTLLNFYSEFQKEELPKAEELPIQNEIVTNNKMLFDCFKDIKQKLECIQLETKEMQINQTQQSQNNNKLSIDLLKAGESKKKLSQFLQ